MALTHVSNEVNVMAIDLQLGVYGHLRHIDGGLGVCKGTTYCQEEYQGSGEGGKGLVMWYGVMV